VYRTSPLTPPLLAPPVYAGGARGVTLLRLLFPSPCLGCGAPASPGARGARAAVRPFGLCTVCRGRLRPLDLAAACAACARPLVGRLPQGFRCGRCRAQPPAFDRLLARWRYEAPLDGVVAGLKFRRLDYLGRHLGIALAEAFAAELAGIDLVVPVPLHWTRRLARGYNQAERIAHPLAERLGLPLLPALRRRRLTPPQSTLPRGARLDNLEGAFEPRRSRPRRSPSPLAGRRVLLVDDVATTTATLDAAARALKRAGAAAVVAVVAGRTPEKPG
jgi:ComF family protein